MNNILKRNRYEERVKVVTAGIEFVGVLKYIPIEDINEMPKSKQVRAKGTSKEGVRKKINQLKTDGLKQPGWIHSNGDLIDMYTRLRGIKEESFDLSEFPDGLPQYVLQGNHTAEEISLLQLKLNKKIEDTQGNDEETITKVLRGMLTGSYKGKSPEEKFEQCKIVVGESVPSSWSATARHNLAKHIFKQCVENSLQALARIEGFTTSMVNELMTAEMTRATDPLHPQYHGMLGTKKDGTKYVRSGKHDGNLMLRILPDKDVGNNVGKEILNRVNCSEHAKIDELHFLFFIPDAPSPADVLSRRQTAEYKLRECFAMINAPWSDNIYVYFVPQILEDCGETIKREPEGVLVSGYGNPKRKKTASTVVKFRAKK